MQRLCRFERYKNNTSAERGAVKSPGSSDEAFSPDEVQIVYKSPLIGLGQYVG